MIGPDDATPANASKFQVQESDGSYREAGDDPRIDVGFRLARYVDKVGGTQ